MSGIGIGGQFAQAPNVAQPKVRAVPLAVDSIDDQLSRLEELTGRLLCRIAPLISPTITGPEGLINPKGSCEFACVLESKAERIRAVADQIDLTLVSLEF